LPMEAKHERGAAGSERIAPEAAIHADHRAGDVAGARRGDEHGEVGETGASTGSGRLPPAQLTSISTLPSAAAAASPMRRGASPEMMSSTMSAARVLRSG